MQEHRHRTLSGCQLCLGRLQQAVDLYRGEMLAGLNFPSDTWEEWLLAQREQVIFAKLSLFRGSFSLEAAHEIAGATLLDLDILQEKSLIQRVAEERYAVHELLRQFASEELDETDALHERFATYYLTWLAGQKEGLNGRSLPQATNAIKQDENNIQQAWQWAIQLRLTNLLTACTDVLGDYYYAQARANQARGVFEALAQNFDAHAPVLHLKALNQLIRFLGKLSRYDEALIILC